MSTNKAWIEEIKIAFNTLEQTKNDIMNTYGMFAWNQDKMSAAEIKLFQNFDAELTKLIQWVNEHRARRLKLNVSCLTYANLKEKFKVLLLEAGRDLETIDFGEKENNYDWRNSMEQFMIDDRKYLIRDFAILIQRLENLQAEFLEKYTAIHEEAIAIVEKSVVEEETKEEAVVAETVVVATAAEAIAVGSATMNKTGTNTTNHSVVGINIANTIAKVTQEINNVKKVVKQQPVVSIVDRIKSTVQKICGAIKDTVVEVKNTAVDIAARIKLTIAAIVA